MKLPTILLLLLFLGTSYSLQDCYEASDSSDSGLCFYNTYSSRGSSSYICDIPFTACNRTLCTKCIEVYNSSVTLTALILSCVSTFGIIVVVVILLTTRRS